LNCLWGPSFMIIDIVHEHLEDTENLLKLHAAFRKHQEISWGHEEKREILLTSKLFSGLSCVKFQILLRQLLQYMNFVVSLLDKISLINQEFLYFASNFLSIVLETVRNNRSTNMGPNYEKTIVVCKRNQWNTCRVIHMEIVGHGEVQMQFHWGLESWWKDPPCQQENSNLSAFFFSVRGHHGIFVQQSQKDRDTSLWKFESRHYIP